MTIKKIYIGCSLTHAPEEFKNAIEELKVTLRKMYDVMDFVGLEKGTPQSVFESDKDNVIQCDLFIAECSHPSLGLGFEIATAYFHNKPTLILARNDAKVSRMILGISHQLFTFARYAECSEIIEWIEHTILTLQNHD